MIGAAPAARGVSTPMSRTRRKLALLALAGAFAATAAQGCSDIDNSIDCNHICDRYQSCFDTNYNTSGCYSRCQSRGTSNDEDRRLIDTCAACINGLSCTGAVFSCGAQCSSIVP